MLTHEDLLQKEKLSLMQHIKSRKNTFHRDNYHYSKKDANVSTSLRKQGNVLYLHFQKNINIISQSAPIDVWNKYAESILYAPNNSEELALGYGNRSAMMFYLSAFEQCIVECDRAMSITSSNCLKLKLLCRKAESLHHLDKSAYEVCLKAQELLNNLNLETTKKNFYERQIFALNNENMIMWELFDLRGPTKFNASVIFNKFERSQEVSCASKSVSIQYNKKWGRHLVAAEDISIGEVIAIEDFYYIYNDSICDLCNNCNTKLFLTNSVPCEHCVFNIYCSESCRKDAWDKYHQFQCPITPFLNFIESITNTSERALKFILLTIHQAGGIDQMKHQLLEIENTDDYRIKGFLNGSFQNGKLINFFCLESCKEEFLEEETRLAYMENSCLCAYLLAKYTNFFGEKMNLLETDIFLNQDILFTAALFLRFYCVSQRNMDEYKRFYHGKKKIYEIYCPFSVLFNHSCDPNVKKIVNPKVIYVARYEIKEGSQLFLNYDSNIFMHKDKKSRQENLQKKHYFICDCIACRENWSSICLPSLKHVSDIVPSLRTLLPLAKIFKLMKLLPKYTEKHEFDSKVAKRIRNALKLLSKNFTVHCKEYCTLLQCLGLLYATALVDHGFIFDVSVCESMFKAQ